MRRRQSNMAGPTTTGRLLSRRSPSAPWSGLPGLPIADAVMVADRADEMAPAIPRSIPVCAGMMAAVVIAPIAVSIVMAGAIRLRQGG